MTSPLGALLRGRARPAVSSGFGALSDQKDHRTESNPVQHRHPQNANANVIPNGSE
jgi:hypothetical protein